MSVVKPSGRTGRASGIADGSYTPPSEVETEIDLTAVPLRRIMNNGVAFPSGLSLNFLGGATYNPAAQSVDVAESFRGRMSPGDASGNEDEIVFKALLAAAQPGDTIRFGGTWHFKDGVDIAGLPDNVTLEGAPGCEFALGSAWAPTGAESVSNAILRVVPTTLAPTTTITSSSVPGSPSLPMTSAFGFTVGTTYSVKGIANDYTGASGGVEEELLKVGAVNALVMSHEWPQHGYHGNTRTVTRLSGVVSGLTIKNIRFNLYDTPGKSAACAVYALRTNNIAVVDCGIKGATFQGVWAEACRSPRINIVDLGGNQSPVHLRSCQNALVDVEVRHEVHERKGTKGGKARPWGSWDNKCRACHVRIHGQRVNGGFRAWGGIACHLEQWVHDVDGTQHKTDAPDSSNVTPRGLVLDTGANELTFAEFFAGNQYDSVSSEAYMGAGEDFNTPIGYMWPVIYPHDGYCARFKVQHTNKGPGRYSTRDLRLGVNFVDITGQIDMQIQGAAIGYCNNNNFSNVTGTLILDSSTGSGTNSGYLMAAHYGDIQPQFDRLEFRGTYTNGFNCGFTAWVATAYHRHPVARVMVAGFDIYDEGIAAYVLRGAGEWRNVRLGRAPNSTANFTHALAENWIGRVFPIDDTVQDVYQIIATAAAATVRPAVLIYGCVNDVAGTHRGVMFCEGGVGFVGLVRAAATMSARAIVESDGAGLAVVQGTFNITTIVGRVGPRQVGAGFMQCTGG